jgi:uncharacterized protein GlcG (DUF336 family)
LAALIFHEEGLHVARIRHLKRRNWQSILNRVGEFFGIHVSNNCKIMIFAGGIPLKLDGKVVGAIGVSGWFRRSGSMPVAAAGAAAF